MAKSAITTTDVGHDNEEIHDLMVFLRIHYKRFTCFLLSWKPAHLEHSKELTDVIHAFQAGWRNGKDRGTQQRCRQCSSPPLSESDIGGRWPFDLTTLEPPTRKD